MNPTACHPHGFLVSICICFGINVTKYPSQMQEKVIVIAKWLLVWKLKLWSLETPAADVHGDALLTIDVGDHEWPGLRASPRASVEASPSPAQHDKSMTASNVVFMPKREVTSLFLVSATHDEVFPIDCSHGLSLGSPDL